jgi:hypothetical protein
MPSILGLGVFTLDIGGKPTLTCEAKNLREAHELCREEWLLDDLSRLTSNGIALWDGRARLRVRYALQTEIDVYRKGSSLAKVPDDELTLVYLVQLDGGAGKGSATVDAPYPEQN